MLYYILKMVKRSKKKTVNLKRNIKNRNNIKGGFRIVLPSQFFNQASNNGNYMPFQLVNPLNKAVSHGYIHTDFQNTGPDLNYTQLNNQTGGGALPAEYYGGNSGRYFEAGSPELESCTHAYGKNINTSHGVVMGEPNNMWLGPNLASFPNFKDMTGGKKSNNKNRKNNKHRNNKTKKNKKRNKKRNKSKKK